MKIQTRTCLLHFAIVTLAVVIAGPARATAFEVLLEGVDVSEGCQAVSIATRFADAQESTAPEAGRSRPGVGLQITIKVKREYSGDKTFSTWRNNVMKGATDRRSITIKFLTDDHRTVLRAYNLFDCFPDDLALETAADGTVQSETLTVKAGRMVFAGGDAATPAPQGNVSAVFDQQGQLEPWTMWGGGEPVLVLKPFMSGTRHHVDSPDATFVMPLSLTGSTAIARPALFRWLNDALSGTPWRDSVAIFESSGRRKLGRTFIYSGCVPLSYSIEGFDSKSSNQLVEVLEIVGHQINYA